MSNSKIGSFAAVSIMPPTAVGVITAITAARARAYLDFLLGKDSRPRPDTGASGDSAGRDVSGRQGADGAAQGHAEGDGSGGSLASGGGPDGGGPGPGEPAGPGQPGASAGPVAGPVPAGFAGRVTLTVPVATLLDMAGRPGELAGTGPVDPWLARDLAAAAAAHPKTTWCVTVTDQDGHAVGHGCARPGPKSHWTWAGPGPRAAGRRHRVLLHPGPPGRPAWRVRNVAAAHPGRRARPDRGARPGHHRPVRSPVPGPGS
jgi:hypothetical protein